MILWVFVVVVISLLCYLADVGVIPFLREPVPFYGGSVVSVLLLLSCTMMLLRIAKMARRGEREGLVEKLRKEKLAMSKKLVEIQMMNETFLDMTSTLVLDEVLKKIIARVTFCLDADLGSVLLIDKKKPDELYIAAAAGLDEEIIKTVRTTVGEGISGWVAKSGEPLLVEDIENDSRFGKKKSDSKYSTKSLISTPLIKRGEVIGVVNVNNKRNNEVFTRDDLELLKNIANQAVVAVENAQFFESAQATG